MSKILVQPDSLVRVPDLNLPGEMAWDNTSFEAFCQLNPGVEAELDADGNLVLMSPSNADADGRHFSFNGQLAIWLNDHAEFKGFGPSAGFTLSNGAVRSPDASLVRREEWDALSTAEQKSFAPLAPFFVMELRSSESDPLAELQEKMVQYLDCGTRLGWLIDPTRSELTIYRPNQSPESHQAPATLAVGDELPGLVIQFADIW